MEDSELMAAALELARQAADAGEVPVGCVIARNGEIVGRGRNRREEGKNALYHAEIEAINDACRNLAAVGMYDVRDPGTLPYVRRCHCQRPDPSGGIWCVG